MKVTRFGTKTPEFSIALDVFGVTISPLIRGLRSQVPMEILGVLAETGFGRIELIRDANDSVAVRKIFAPRPHVLGTVSLEQLRRRFAREVCIQRQLPATLVMPVLVSALEAEPPWFAMPLAEMTFEQRISAFKSNTAETASALAQVLDAVGELHRLGYVHRDLKPSNILFHNGRWKLADLGLVLPLSTEGKLTSSQEQGWSTISYCAPEQFVRFKSVGPAADIYSVGCILHDLFGQQARLPFHQISESGRIGAVMQKSTESDPKKRFKSVQRLRAALLYALAPDSER